MAEAGLALPLMLGRFEGTIDLLLKFTLVPAAGSFSLSKFRFNYCQLLRQKSAVKMFKAKRIVAVSFAIGALSLVFVVRRSTVRPVRAQASGCTDPALALAQGQLTDTLAYTSTSQFPTETNPANANKWSLAGPSNWTSGFFPGSLWYMYENTLDNSWMTRATAQTSSMLSQGTNAADHDIGFKILGSYGNAYRITRDPSYMNVIQTAAQSMTTLYRPTAGVFESWPNFDSHITVIIDNMMNLELPFFAAQNGGDPNWYNMAVSHAVKTMQNHVRADGGTYHVVDYNPDGTVYSKFTAQGAGNETTWARGQAWAIYGFTMTYRYTKDPRFLATAQNLANYFLNNLPSDFVPYWDFSKCCADPRDSSAAAIAAAGLLELSTYVGTTDQARYHAAALNIQSSLSSPAYLGDRINTDGVLLHGSANVPGGDSNKSLVYGDYYFIQGCYRATSPPPAPTNLSATRTSGTQSMLAWDAQTGATRYSVKRTTTSGGPYITVTPPPVWTTNSFADTALDPSATYYYVVSATNVGGEGPDSAEASSAVINPAPSISSISPTNVPAGAAFTLTVNGANFSSSSVLNFGGKAEPTTFVNATQLTAAIPATDASSGGTPAVTVSNPAGVSPAVSFAINDFTVGAAPAVTVAAGMSASTSITITPVNTNGFSSAIAFSVSGLPANVTAMFNPPSVMPGNSPVSTTLTISAAARSTIIPVAPSLPGSIGWRFQLIYLFVALLAEFLLLQLVRRPRSQVCLASLLLALLLSSGVALSGCGGGSGGGGANTTTPTPQAVATQVTVIAQSGSDSKTIPLTISVH
jgi:unsaturated chondroitin disaccharide hydrolase